jgi:hypothetical protein
MSNRAKNNLAFTLVEIVAALGAFSIAFLAGFAAIGALMIRQDINYRHTVAASMATLLLKDSADWNKSKLNATTLGTLYKTEPNNGMVKGCKFRGYPIQINATTVSIPLDSSNTDVPIYYLKDKADLPAGFDFEEYRPILVTKLKDIVASNPQALAFWYGAPDVVAVDQSTTLDFLGAYIYE